jgi:phosphoglycerol transferase MdoB-like AlkP superfamily enzyme
MRPGLRTVLAILSIGALQRLAVLLLFPESPGSLAKSILLGLAYDVSVTSYILLVYWIFYKLFKKRFADAFYAGALILWVLLSAVDLYSLKFNGVRASIHSLNVVRWHDVSDKLGETRITAYCILYIAVFTGLLMVLRKQLIPAIPLASTREKLWFALTCLAFTFVYLPFPLNYYADQVRITRTARQIAVHPFYSWVGSVLNIPSFDVDHDEIKRFAVACGFDTTSKNFLVREVDYGSPVYENVMLVVMESFGAGRTGALGGRKALSPFFDTLCRDGVLYTKTFSTGPRTQYGITSILFGFPHILEYNLFRKNKQKLPFQGLLHLLARNGYSTHFLHGGRASYDDMGLFLSGDDGRLQISDMTAVRDYAFKNVWGVDDGSFFKHSVKYISSRRGRNFYCLLTMSNHEPFQLPDHFKPRTGLSASENAFLYADGALEGFIHGLKQKGLYEKSLIIITGDHGERYAGEDALTKLFHVPLLIIDHKNKGVDNLARSHADIAEYILSKTGYKGKTHFTGRGLVNDGQRQVYYRDYDNNLYMLSDTMIYRYNLSARQLYRMSCDEHLYVVNEIEIHDRGEAIKKEMQTFLDVNRFIFENGLYYSN